MTFSRRLILALGALLLATSVTACGETWRGVKQDTGENLEKSGKAIERTGEKTKPEEKKSY